MKPKTYPFTRKPSAVRPRSSKSGDAGGDSYVAGVPLSRVIPRELKECSELVVLSDSRSVAAERFRRLASTLHSKAGDEPLVVVVTSAVPNEGKTTVALNLGLALGSDADGDTLIVDADLRRPAIHNWLKQPPGLGLNEVLSGKVSIDHAIHELKNAKLKVLPAGSPCGDPLELLGSSEAKALIAALRTQFRQVIIDTPPVIPFSDAQVLGRLATGTLLVARSRHTAKKAYQHAVSLLDGHHVFGVVMNQYEQALADGRVSQDSYYSDYYYRDKRKK